MMAASNSDFTEPEADDEIDEVLEGHILDVPAREPLEEFASLQAARPFYFSCLIDFGWRDRTDVVPSSGWQVARAPRRSLSIKWLFRDHGEAADLHGPPRDDARRSARARGDDAVPDARVRQRRFAQPRLRLGGGGGGRRGAPAGCPGHERLPERNRLHERRNRGG